MKTFKIGLTISLLLLMCAACDKEGTTAIQEEPVDDDKIDVNELYFPPTSSSDWETVDPSDLSWNTSAITDLNNFLDSNNSKSFMILYNGRIVIEEYYNGHSATDLWRWNSAGKTLVTTTTGIAQQNGLMDINNKVSDYIGEDWTSTTDEQEDLIKVKNLLSMTSGLDDEPQLVVKSNLTYLADAGSRWAYGNVFQRLMDVVEDASGITFENYFNNELRDKIGMDGEWNNGLVFRIYFSNTRSMARFGHLAAQNGYWDGTQVLDRAFFIESMSTSQDINPSYGYLWWLNGKSQYMLPSDQSEYTGSMVPNAPDDMIAAMGKDEQRIYIIPSKDLVIIRMGEAAGSGDDFALSSFDNLLWEKINAVIE